MPIDFRCYCITDRRQTGGRPLIAALQAAAHAGITAVQIREKDLTPRELYALCIEARDALRPLGVRVLVNDRADIACAAGLDGVHLTTTSLSATATRRCLGDGALIGVSTHTLTEARFAEASGADFLTFGPVYHTASKTPYGPPVGLDVLRDVCAAVAIPVFALGGITPERVPECLAAGAHGVAAISALLNGERIDEAVEAFTAQLGEL